MFLRNSSNHFSEMNQFWKAHFVPLNVILIVGDPLKFEFQKFHEADIVTNKIVFVLRAII